MNNIDNITERDLDNIKKEYNLDLRDIELIKIMENNIEVKYIKYHDKDNNTIKMIKYNDERNLKDSFKDIQEELSYAKGEDGVYNSKIIFDSLASKTKEIYNFIEVKNLLQNYNAYKQQIDSLTRRQIEKMRYCLSNAAKLRIKYINLETEIVITEDGITLHVGYDETEKGFYIEKTETEKYEQKNEKVDENNMPIEINDVNFDEVVESHNITEPGEEIIIANEKISTNDLYEYYKYPELLEKRYRAEQINKKTKTIIEYIIKAQEKKENRNVSLVNKPKQLILKPTDNLFSNRAAFVNNIFMFVILILSSIFIMSLSLLYIMMKS